MPYLAVTTLPELAGVLTIIAGMLLGFYGVIKFILNQAIQDRHDDRKERLHLVDSLEKVASSNQEIANATKQAAKEAKERNGHLADLIVQSKEEIKTVAQKNYDAIQNVKSQHVDKQVVDQQVIKEDKK